MEEPEMSANITRSLEVLAEPFRAERDTQERRQRLTDCALRSLPYSATEAERARAAVAIREAPQALDSSADECEMRVAAEEAVRPVREAIEGRELEERLIRWAIQELPFTKTEADTA